MLPDAQDIAQRGGSTPASLAEARAWLDRNCNAETCSFRAYQDHPGRLGLEHYRQVLEILDVLPETKRCSLLTNWTPGELQALSGVKKFDKATS